MMTYKQIIIFTILFFLFSNIYAQKKPLDVEAYSIWKTLSNVAISNNGNFVVYEIAPYKGDGVLEIYDARKREKFIVQRGAGAIISANSEFLLCRIKPQSDTVRALKLKKKKGDDLPKDSLAVVRFKTQAVEKYPNLNNFKTPNETSDWYAYTYTEVLPDSLKSKKKPKVFDESAPKMFDFCITNTSNLKTYRFKNISDFEFSRNGNLLTFIKLQNDSLLKSTVYFFDTRSEKLDSLPSETGLAQNLACDNEGKQFAYIFSRDTVSRKVYALHLWGSESRKATVVADSLSPELPKNWSVSPNGTVYFSRDDSKLYFGTAPKPEYPTKDTLLEEEKVNVDIWHWNDPFIQSEQLMNLEKDKKLSYLSVYHTDTRKIIQLGDTVLKEPIPVNKGNGRYMLASDIFPYAKMRTWDVTGYRDMYLVDSKDGSKLKILSNFAGFAELSPSCETVVFYEKNDSSWYSYSIEKKCFTNLSGDTRVSFALEQYDNPELPSAYGLAGWINDGKSVWIYDRYDIWQFDLAGKIPPVNLTKNGRILKTEYRYLKLDRDEIFINTKQVLLAVFETESKKEGFAVLKPGKLPEVLISDNFKYSNVIKAKESDALIVRKQSAQEYPDVYLSDTKFTMLSKISETNPQQPKYLWATSELFSWTLPDGTVEEGLLYKPENFEPTKKYPLLVYFYELYSDELNQHWHPSPSRSVINPTVYASNGYLVFIPNIRYNTGEPGESAKKYIMSGTRALCKNSYVDSTRVGMQGQSWGGYQVAYLVTQTDFFKAAAAGAPVSNMFSAYGGIRWESGMSRAFQYEKTQSRIGASPWDVPGLYVKNSPIFHVPNISTPLLIMHNDKDGAVPWTQSIEMYIAMRRLNKPVWMLNYNGEPHNLKADSPNRIDLSIRLMQFFDTYLKDKPAPLWIREGIPATKKGEDFGLK